MATTAREEWILNWLTKNESTDATDFAFLKAFEDKFYPCAHNAAARSLKRLFDKMLVVRKRVSIINDPITANCPKWVWVYRVKLLGRP